MVIGQGIIKYSKNIYHSLSVKIIVIALLSLLWQGGSEAVEGFSG